jgi:hypothetical protein
MSVVAIEKGGPLLRLTMFRMNTSKNEAKQATLTSFRINTYEKHGEGVHRAFDMPNPSARVASASATDQ